MRLLVRGNSDKVPVNTRHGMRYTSEWLAWKNMRSRCTNPKDISYKNYGAKGITYCSRWLVFENFYEDMGKKPSPQYSLDRIDNDKGYVPENCRWASKSVQTINRSIKPKHKVMGVRWVENKKRWRACIGLGGQWVHLGHFKTEEAAIAARQSAEKLYYAPMLEEGC